jgi:hypothetical protein
MLYFIVSCTVVFNSNSLQISEVVNSMKDLIDFCRDNRVGPIGNFFLAFAITYHFVTFELAC